MLGEGSSIGEQPEIAAKINELMATIKKDQMSIEQRTQERLEKKY
jgi:hypothetical protein